jgi:dienelactone hydrolase
MFLVTCVVLAAAARAEAAECGGESTNYNRAEGSPSPVTFPTDATTYCKPRPSKVALFVPSKGSAPFPAVIVLPTCAAMKDSQYDWMKLFTEQGYAVLSLDYYWARKINGNCHPNINLRDPDAASDVHAAWAHLRTLPQINRDKIGLVGYSLGGTVAIVAAGRPAALNGDPVVFQAVVAF